MGLYFCFLFANQSNWPQNDPSCTDFIIFFQYQQKIIDVQMLFLLLCYQLILCLHLLHFWMNSQPFFAYGTLSCGVRSSFGKESSDMMNKFSTESVQNYNVPFTLFNNATFFWKLMVWFTIEMIAPTANIKILSLFGIRK